jgi:hypothetical protein
MLWVSLTAIPLELVASVIGGAVLFGVMSK